MPEIITAENNNQKAGVKRLKYHSLKIDMTPMVDLGFLLISFFVMTIQMSKPSEVKFNMPKDGIGTEIQNSAALTVLLGKNREVRYYHGDWATAFQQNQIFKTSFSYKNGIGDVIRNKQSVLDSNPIITNGRKDLTILIKPADNSNYTGIVDVLDEVIINDVKRYALVKITDEEKTFLKRTDQ